MSTDSTTVAYCGVPLPLPDTPYSLVRPEDHEGETLIPPPSGGYPEDKTVYRFLLLLATLRVALLAVLLGAALLAGARLLVVLLGAALLAGALRALVLAAATARLARLSSPFSDLGFLLSALDLKLPQPPAFATFLLSWEMPPMEPPPMGPATRPPMRERSALFISLRILLASLLVKLQRPVSGSFS